MTERTERASLAIAAELARFIEEEALPGTDIEAMSFWAGLSAAIDDLGPANRALLARRDSLQAQIDDWHRGHRDGTFDPRDYRAFLKKIGYITDEGDAFQIETEGIDREIALVAGPQLITPLTNAHYTLNAVNARWGSLYKALCQSDALGVAGNGQTPARWQKIIDWGRGFLDSAVPLVGASWREARGLILVDGKLSVRLNAGSSKLAQPRKLAGWRGEPTAPGAVILENNGLHIEIRIDGDSEAGAMDSARISDIRLESALTAIMDCEDGIVAVDAADKVAIYRNWLNLMRGDPGFADDIKFTAPDGQPANLRARSLLMIRNVGLLTGSDAILDANGDEIPEGIMDAFVTSLCALHDLKRETGTRNSAIGAIYIVKPKLHSPEEVTFTIDLFSKAEATLNLPPDTIKLGLMDEERRLSVNLKEAIRAAKARIAFINTGFLDRTGDEIHTSIEAGAMIGKTAMETAPWFDAYEARNVEIGLDCGFSRRAQIGKGMWTRPENMAAMLDEKIAQPKAGANCAWVPSPMAATLHATHYHRVDVFARHQEIIADECRAGLERLLTIPLADVAADADAILAEAESCVRGILGYVLRWVNEGIGVSKVVDLNGIARMEDRATCRLSSQLLANWLHHGLVSEDQLVAALKDAVADIDSRNASDPSYQPIAMDPGNPAIAAVRELILQGRQMPSGYVDPVLYAARRDRKRILARAG